MTPMNVSRENPGSRWALFAYILLFVSSGCANKDAPLVGEELVFFPSVASISADGNSWLLTIQGRVFEPAADSAGRKLLIDAVAKVADLDDKDARSELFRQRAGYFLSDSKRNARVTIRVGERTFRLPPSDAGGYFNTQISLTKAEVVKFASQGVVPFESLPTVHNPRRFHGYAVLVPEEGISVVTDMDDTIKDTHVLDRKEMLKNTFVRPFVAVAGMPALYRAWQKELGSRIQFHVVSAGPWQLNEPLRQFTDEAGFPPFTWHMRSVAVDAVHLGELTGSPYDFKVPTIEALIRQFPKRHVVCVGDSGEKDPEVYSKLLSEFPDRVDAVFIHDVTDQSQDADRYVKLFPGQAALKLHVFRDPQDLPRILSP